MPAHPTADPLAEARPTPPVGALALWTGLLGGPLVWVLEFNVAYPLASNACANHLAPVAYAVSGGCLLLTLGVGALVISAARSTRQSIVPLWSESQGVDAATTSIIYGVSAGVDMLLFYPGGAIMDRFGRVFVAVPSMVVLGLGFLLLPLANGPVTIGLVACLMGLGNGISAGIVMTLGADASPAVGRSQFLGGWRLAADVGGAGGPLVISAVSLVAPLAVAALTIGLLTWAGSAWLARWVPVFAPGPQRASRRGGAGRGDHKV